MTIDIMPTYPPELCFTIDCLPSTPKTEFVTNHDHTSFVVVFDLNGASLFPKVRQAVLDAQQADRLPFMSLGGTSNAKKKADLTTPKDAA